MISVKRTLRSFAVALTLSVAPIAAYGQAPADADVSTLR